MNSSTELLIGLGGILLFAIAADIVGRRTFLPRVTLLILFGILIGDSGLALMPTQMTNQFELIGNIALLMVGFLIGGTLSKKTMRGAMKRTFWIAMSAALGTVLIVTIGLYILGTNLDLAILFGCIAAATDPAVTMDAISETDDRSAFENLLISVVAVDDAIGLALFSVGVAVVTSINGSDFSAIPMLTATQEIGGAIILGLAIGLPAAFLTGRLHPGKPILIEALAIVFLCGGLALWYEVSYLIASMTMGCVIANLANHHERPFHEIEGIEWVFLIVFFTLAGASLNLTSLKEFTVIGIGYIIFRILGKNVGGQAGAIIGATNRNTRIWIGPALLPQAGVAVGMALVAGNLFPHYQQELLSVVVSTTIFFEIFGPIATRFSLNRVSAADENKKTI